MTRCVQKLSRFRFAAALSLVLVSACAEAPLITGVLTNNLNSPVSMTLIPGTTLAVVANANVNLDKTSGSLVAVDLVAQNILYNTQIAIPNFAGRMYADATRLYIVDRGNDAVLVYDYSVPGTSGEAISFSSVSVTNPAKDTTNGIRTDENPFDIWFYSPTSGPDVFFVSNVFDGSLSALNIGLLEPIDLDPDHSEFFGLPLISASNFQIESSRPGRGANRLVQAPAPNNRLLYVTSSADNEIYIVDQEDRQIEAMLDLSAVSISGGTRGMAITASNEAYIAHTGVDGLVVLDVSNVTDNGIDFELVSAQFIDLIPTGVDPDGVSLSLDGMRLFVTNQQDNNVAQVDILTRTVLSKTGVGNTPGDIFRDDARAVHYVLNFLDDSISILSDATGALVETLK